MLVATAARAEYSFPEPVWTDPCALLTPDATYVTSTIVMQLESRRVNLRIPVDYFEDRADQQNGVETTSQLFSVEIGSFKPVTRHGTFIKRLGGLKDYLSFTVGDTVELDKIAVKSAEKYGLGILPDLSVYARKRGPFSLSEIRSSVMQIQPQFEFNVYISDPTFGIPDAILDCDAPGTEINPGCDHLFRASSMDVNLHYDRNYLPYWHEIQDSIPGFLICAAKHDM